MLVVRAIGYAMLLFAVALLPGATEAKGRKTVARASKLARQSQSQIMSVARSMGAGPKDFVIYRNGESDDHLLSELNPTSCATFSLRR